MPIGTRGIISVNEIDDESSRTICWETTYSVWHFFAVQIVRLLHTSGVGLG